jgi:hypothetical protein
MTSDRGNALAGFHLFTFNEGGKDRGMATGVAGAFGARTRRPSRQDGRRVTATGGLPSTGLSHGRPRSTCP